MKNKMDPPLPRTSEAGPPNTKKISATPENIEDHGVHPPNFGDATTEWRLPNAELLGGGHRGKGARLARAELYD